MSHPEAPGVVTLLTDFGARDYYVAALKGTLLRLAPGSVLVDITHDVAPGDVEEAAFVLTAAAPSFPPGTLHLAVVDPGVGSARAILALECAGGHFLAPDNGLLTRQLATPDGPAIAVDRPDLYSDAPGATFHGRDRFAPIAAAWLRGGGLAALGRPLAAPVRLSIPDPRRLQDTLRGRVAHVDRFGNLVTDIPARWMSAGLLVEVGAHATDVHATHYAELAAGVAAWMTGSLGTVELALRDASLAAAWGVARGATVLVRVP